MIFGGNLFWLLPIIGYLRIGHVATQGYRGKCQRVYCAHNDDHHHARGVYWDDWLTLDSQRRLLQATLISGRSGKSPGEGECTCHWRHTCVKAKRPT